MKLKFFYAATLAVAPGFCLAQQASLTPPPTNFVSSDPDAPVSSTASPAAVVASGQQTSPVLSPWESKLDRWVDVDDLSIGFRYRKEVPNDDHAYFNNGQQKSLVDGRFKFDSGGKYAVNFHVSSGRTFNWAYADEIGDDFSKLSSEPGAITALTPAQLQAVIAALGADPNAAKAEVSRGWEMSFRQLYFSAAPIKQLAFEYGSLYIDKGASTEATSYDDDGYITGERVRVFDPKHLYLDQIAFTNAYEGDINTPSFFERGERLKEAGNYRQVLAAKNFGKRFQASADYTFDKGTHTTHEAILAKLPEVKAVDSVRLELYQRLNDTLLEGQTFYAHQGFAVTGSKTFHKNFLLEGGYAHIDTDYGVLVGDRVDAAVGFSMNGDSFLTGSRVFTRASWKVAPGVSLSGYYTHLTGSYAPSVLLINKEGLNGGMTIDLKKLLTKARVM